MPVKTANGQPKNKVADTIGKVVFANDHNQCRCCGTMLSLTCDHIKPESVAGDSSNPADFQTLCQKCNAKKCTVTVEFPVKPAQFRAAEVANEMGLDAEMVKAILTVATRQTLEAQAIAGSNFSQARKAKKLGQSEQNWFDQNVFTK